HALLPGLAVGEKTAGGGQDGDTKAAENLGELRRLRVHAEARLRDALDARDRALALRAVLQRDGEGLADAGVSLLVAGDVALLLEDRGDVLLQLARRQRHLVVVRRVRVAQTGQHICDRVCHGHMSVPLFMRFRLPLHDRRPSTTWIANIRLSTRMPGPAKPSPASSAVSLSGVIRSGALDEREAEVCQQRTALVVGLRGRDDRDVEAADAVDLVL